LSIQEGEKFVESKTPRSEKKENIFVRKKERHPVEKKKRTGKRRRFDPIGEEVSNRFIEGLSRRCLRARKNVSPKKRGKGRR